MRDAVFGIKDVHDLDAAHASASAIIERWQRHQTASEHMIAVRALFATSNSWSRPWANSVVDI
jgi:hypothetical protein